MRIVRLRVDAFGGLAGVDTGDGDLPGIVAVVGPNEAGKSTLFRFLTTVLYGFHPAARESNPYAPWSGEDAAGGAVITLEDGTRVEVERRLRSQPAGRLTTPDSVEELRNRPVPWVDHVPRKVFQQVFALTLSDLAGLDVETWATVQERLAGAMGATDIRSPRSVAAELEREAGELWRPNRRGNQRVRALQREARDLRRQRREAGERDRELRQLVEASQAERERLRQAREERHRHRLAVERAQLLVPIREQLRRIDGLLEEAGDTAELDGIPPDPESRLAELDAAVEESRRRIAALNDDAEAPAAALDAHGEADAAVLERADDIRRLVAGAAALEPERVRARAVEQEIRDLERRLASAASGVLTGPPEGEEVHALAKLPLAELRSLVRRYTTARDERRTIEATVQREAAEAPAAAPPPSPAGAVAALLAGAVLLALGIRDGSVWISLAGGLAAAAGAAFLYLWWRRRGETASPGATLEDRLADRTRESREREEAARAGIARLLDGLPVPEPLLEDPDHLLVTGLERVQELLRDIDDRRTTLAELTARADALADQARALAERLGVAHQDDPIATSRLLDQALRDAERRREAAHAASREMDRIRREIAREEEALEEATAARQHLRDLLSHLGGGDVARGAAVARARMDARDRAVQLLDELERSHPDLDEIRRRIADAEGAGEAWTLDDEALARTKARIDELNDLIERLARSVEAHEKDIEHLQGQVTVDALDGELQALHEEEARLVRRRDRLWAVAQLLREADRRFREEHQPDMVRRAGSYLEHITGGRYDRILVDETADGDVFSVNGPGLDRPVPLAHPISTGTLEQAYLAMRLGIVDHLDRAGERLPLFVDEVFVNWDARRSRRGAELLATLAGTRQVFVFTCHRPYAEELERLGARILDLGLEGL